MYSRRPALVLVKPKERMRLRLRWIPALLVVASSLAIAACGSAGTTGSDAKSSAGNSSSVKEPTSCSFAPASTVSSTLGMQVGTPEESSKQAGGQTVLVCIYRTQTPGGIVTLQSTPGANAAGFAGAKGVAARSGATQDVSGVGDQAFASTSGAGDIQTTTLFVRKGSLLLTLISPAPLANEKALINTLLPSL